MYKPVTPKTFKRILEKSKYELVAQDASNWIMESNGHVIVIPQTMKEIPDDVIETMLGPSGIEEAMFFKLLQEIDPAAASAPASSSTTSATATQQPTFERPSKPESR